MSAVPAPCVGPAAPADQGFTLVEVLVALTLISTMMAALAPFLVRSVNVVAEMGGRQTAIQLADASMERVSALTGATALTGRSYHAAKAQWDAVYAATAVPSHADALKPYLDTMSLGDPQYATHATKAVWLAWDLQLPSTSTAGTSAGLPTTAVEATINGVPFQMNWYLGMCRTKLGSGGTCDNPEAADPEPGRADVPLLRVVIAVTWPGRDCPGGACAYVTSTLVSASGDLVFNLNRPAPVAVSAGPQTSYAAMAISGLQLSATGGQLPLTWSFSGLPPGLSGSASGLVTGTPTDPGVTKTYTVTTTVTDKLGRTSSATFSWTIVPVPVVTNPGNQSTRSGTAASLSMAVTGGPAPFTWSATGLPAGLSIDAATGKISGTPTATSRVDAAVTVTATDNVGRASSVSFTWSVLTLAVAALPTRADSIRDTVSFTVPTPTGGKGPYTYRMDNYPGESSGEIGIDANIGKISGKVWYGNRYFTTVYVKDATGDEVATTFLWNVSPSQPNDLTIIVPDPANPNQTSKVGQPVSLMAYAPTGSNSGYDWSATTGLPPGLSIATQNYFYGAITGTPTTAGVYRVTLVCQDSNYKQAVVMFDWTVTP
ncbi:putative Ig domain-containing protein [Actinoplanes sp. NPDC023801]|uniref:putative Ig domain-containing protein n=1 Tax=Actinoplanes sp. NPDC023801 TaxID=3154595 RepID=UPI00340AE009